MSHSLSPRQFEELHDLITALHEKCITEDQRAQLEAYICQNEEACRIYVQYTHLYANLRWREMQEPDLGQAPPSGQVGSAKTPILGFLGDAFQAGVDFLSRGLVVSLLLTIGLPTVMLLILMLHVSRQPIPSAPATGPVASIVQTHECVWNKDGLPMPVGANLFSGQRVQLNKGLVEVKFADGASVLIEGPTTFEVGTAGEGFLHVGKLVAQVPKGAEGFTIGTHSATVIDYGTEFGVSVEDERGTVEVQVFQGEVALQAGPENADPKSPTHQRLTAGHAARVELASRVGQKDKFVVRKVTAKASHFVRRLPVLAKSAKPVIVADFSGGVGNERADQYPGTTGLGWKDGWFYKETKQFKTTVSVDQAHPLRDGGKYLRVLVERASGSDSAFRTIERRMDLTGPVDLRKPHVVSFDIRIDELGGFSKFLDHLIICNNMCPNLMKRKGPSSGWHIRVAGKSYKGIPARQWMFVTNDGQGEHKVDSGIPAKEGTVYSFRILFEPSKSQWTPSISIDGNSWTKFNTMSTRSLGTAEDRGYWPYFYFYWMLDGGNQNGEIEKIGFSVDSIRITAAE